MMYQEYCEYCKAAKLEPESQLAYAECIEPLYMMLPDKLMDKAAFVKFAGKNTELVHAVGEYIVSSEAQVLELRGELEATKEAAAAKEKELTSRLDVEAASAAANIKMLGDQLNDIMDRLQQSENKAAWLEADREHLRIRIREMTRWMCDDCLNRILFPIRDLTAEKEASK